MEEWTPIKGFDGYSVSPLGQVRNDYTGRILRTQFTQGGVAFVGMLMPHVGQKQRGVAKLVAQAYIPNDLESFDTPINLDGDRANCAVDNLMWRPRWFAIQYHMQFRERFPYPIPSPLRDLNTDEIYTCSWDVCVRFGLLERDVVNSIGLRTYVWPTYQMFDLAD